MLLVMVGLASCSTFYRVGNLRQLFRIGEVSQPAHLPLVLNQIGLRDKRNWQTLQQLFNPVSSHLVEAHFTDGRKNVDMVLFRAEAKVLLIVEQVGKLQAIERNAQREQSTKRGARIFFRGPDEEVEVMSGANVTMHDHRHAAHHGVLNLCGGERG
jgi:hypothetical protein